MTSMVQMDLYSKLSGMECYVKKWVWIDFATELITKGWGCNPGNVALVRPAAG